jgi:hypothetical protein
MSVAIVTVAYGEKYRAFLPQWCERVSQLHTEPEQIIIVTDDVEECEVTVNWLPGMTIIANTVEPKVHPQVCVNDAIREADTEWVCKMDVDDLIYPHALNRLADCDADVYMFGIRLGVANLPARHVTRGDVLRTPHNLVFSGSPFRRRVWQESPYLDMICEDWRFWVDAARNGARFQASPTIDYEYVIHGENISQRSDISQWEDEVRAYQEGLRRGIS